MSGRIALVNPGIRRHRIPLFRGLAKKFGANIDFLIIDFDDFLRLEHLTTQDLKFVGDNRSNLFKFQCKRPLASIRVLIKIYFHLILYKYKVIVWASSEHSVWPLLLIKGAIPWQPRVLMWTSRWKTIDSRFSRVHEKINLEILNICDAVVCASRPSFDYYIQRGFDISKLHLIEEGSSEVHESDSRLPAIRRSGVVIGYIGQLIHRKGVDILIQAFAEASANNSYATLVIAGEGTEKEELEKLAKSLCSEKIIFSGFVESMWSFFQNVDLIVYPTRFDPQGLVIAESLSAGVPVVTTYSAGLHYYIHDMENGIVVEPNDQDSLRMALSSYLTSEALRSKLKRGALLTARDHPIDKMIEDFRNVLSLTTERRQGEHQ